MPKNKFNQYLIELKSFSNVLALSGALIPGLSYFTKLTPPYLEEASLLTAALATATISITYFYTPRRKNLKFGLPSIIRLAIYLFGFSFASFVLYIVLFQLCTVSDPRGEMRFQTGFGRVEWSLTQEGRQWKASNPSQTVQQWMLSAAAFRAGGPELFWKPWTIVLSGVSMILTFMLSFVSWSFAWALLAKQKSLAKDS